MDKKHTEVYERFCASVDAAVGGWFKADRLTAIEQRERAQTTINGIAFAALHVLKSEEYHDLVNYIHEKGFNH